MKKLLLHCFTLLSITLFVFGCTQSDDELAVVQGYVTDSQTGNSIENATIQVTSPAELSNLFVRSDETGNYNMGDIEVEEVTELTLTASASEYNDETRSLNIAPGDNITGFDFELLSENASSDDGTDEVVGEAGGPAQIELIPMSNTSINVAETGGITSTTFTFVVKDSANRKVDRDHEVLFEIIRGPGGGEYITPESALTNGEGRVTSALVSGDSSGTVRVEARIERPDVGLTIRSTPVIVSISSGFPHPDNFNVAPRVYNFDAYSHIDETYTNVITASVGDKKGNPVKVGTAVYFSAQYGGLVNGSATTNENGYASVNLSANGSTPQNHPMGVGFIDVIAQTVDKDNNYIEKDVTMLLTTREASISVTPGTFNIGNGGTETFDVVITDLNGNPMATNTQISVTAEPGLTAGGDIVDLQLPNYLTPGPGRTEFSLTISDDDANEIVSEDGSFTIKVETPSGGVTTKTISGQRAKTN
ncbi:MAG: carboxypeptidase regulatory-like domain-containing protein [Gracilimonas sp.]|uniref:carboxypeptidase regulatory-like domain-containing protein n=1 Tax=Gracilimonas sp. TaxID=1974203 RepID=UPI0019A64695|nr:carboxypeptidase regulatory-like domain-containing protein [Gracilimonas sp.]MBD3615703.1 carboxypeptidase regulatory-like domain-containing protein [Gracilimonas sp.]